MTDEQIAELLHNTIGEYLAENKMNFKDEIIEKMIGGRIRKYLAEITLVGQPFVKDPDQTVEKLLKLKGAGVKSFNRFEVGEGIEKKVENCAEEVMAQLNG